MKQLCIAGAITMLCFSSLSIASESDAVDGSSSCIAIVKACKAAGYERAKEDKKFWQDCMHPLLLGKSVKEVQIDANQVKACREKKIDELQIQLKELQDIK